MADKKLNEVTKVTDMAYVPVIMSDGSIGQIAKADLATVVAGLLPLANSSNRGALSVFQFMYGKQFVASKNKSWVAKLFSIRYTSGAVCQIHFWSRNSSGKMFELTVRFHYGSTVVVNKIDVPSGLGTILSLYYTINGDNLVLYASIPTYIQIMYEVEFCNISVDIANTEDSIDVSTLTNIGIL